MDPVAVKHSFDGATLRAISIIVGAVFLLSGCSLGGGPRAFLAPPPPVFTPISEGTGVGISIPVMSPKEKDMRRLDVKDPKAALLTQDPVVPEGCSVLDRFDRSSALSITSLDGRREWALNLRTSGASVDAALIRFRYQWGGPSKQKGIALGEKSSCLYPARTQGFLGSAYHELIVRDKHTLWHQLRRLRTDLKR